MIRLDSLFLLGLSLPLLAQGPAMADRIKQPLGGQVEAALEPDGNAADPMMKMAPCAKPELSIQRISFATPLTVGQNSNQVTVVLRNSGLAAAGNFFVNAVLCPASGPCAGGMFPYSFGGSAMKGILGPNQSATLTLQSLHPFLKIPGGSYRLRLTVDASNIVAECNEANNIRTTLPLSFGATCSTPDFFIAGVGPVPMITAASKGQTVTASVSVFNQGAVYNASAGAKVRLLLVDNANLGQQTLVWEGLLGNLTTGQSNHFTLLPITIPNTLTTGNQYRWRAIADANATVAECNEGNNLSDNTALLKIN